MPCPGTGVVFSRPCGAGRGEGNGPAARPVVVPWLCVPWGGCLSFIPYAVFMSRGGVGQGFNLFPDITLP